MQETLSVIFALYVILLRVYLLWSYSPAVFLFVDFLGTLDPTKTVLHRQIPLI